MYVQVWVTGQHLPSQLFWSNCSQDSCKALLLSLLMQSYLCMCARDDLCIHMHVSWGQEVIQPSIVCTCSVHVCTVCCWRSERTCASAATVRSSKSRFAIDICLVCTNHTEHAQKGHRHGDDLWRSNIKLQEQRRVWRRLGCVLRKRRDLAC